MWRRESGEDADVGLHLVGSCPPPPCMLLSLELEWECKDFRFLLRGRVFGQPELLCPVTIGTPFCEIERFEKPWLGSLRPPLAVISHMLGQTILCTAYAVA